MAYFEVTKYNSDTAFKVQIIGWSGPPPAWGFYYFVTYNNTDRDYSRTSSDTLVQFEGLPAGSYTVKVGYDDNGLLTYLTTQSGNNTVNFTISSGGGDEPTGDSTFTAISGNGTITISVDNQARYNRFGYSLYDRDPTQDSTAQPIDLGSDYAGTYEFTGLSRGYYWIAVQGQDSSGEWHNCYGIDIQGIGHIYLEAYVQNGYLTEPTFIARLTDDGYGIYVEVVDNDGVITTNICRAIFDDVWQVPAFEPNDSYSWWPAADTYTVKVIYQTSSGGFNQIKTSSGQASVDITVPERPIEQTWSYTKIPSNIQGGINVSSVGSLQANYSDTKKNGKKFVIYFNQAGTLRIWSTNTSGGLISYAETEDNGYNEATGKPYGSGNETIGSFDYSLYGPEGTNFYLWVNSNSTEYEYYLNASFVAAPTPVTVPSYTFSINDNKITFNVSDKGDFYLSYIARLWDDQDDRSYTNYYTNNTTVTTSALLYNTKYAVNVGYSTENNGVITWIGKREAQIGNEKEPFNYSLISGITISDSNPNPISISFAKNNGVIVPITISYNGVVTVYTETSQSIAMNDIAYLCNSSNKSYSPSTGEVYDYIKYDDDSHGNGEFQMTINNSGTQSYYLYIRGIVDPEDNNTPIAINTRLYAIISEEECVWIYTGISTNGGWQKAIPYIYTGSGSENGWQKAISYIYTGSGSENGWQKATE